MQLLPTCEKLISDSPRGIINQRLHVSPKFRRSLLSLSHGMA